VVFTIWLSQHTLIFHTNFRTKIIRVLFGLGRRHKSQDVIEWCIENHPNVPEGEYTQPPKAMPDHYKVDDVVQSYRNYYCGDKKSFSKWKNREVPSWFS